ncbi:hypothetical protein B0H10DRAFT_1965569 [Mycena sp. CBHHK59/15]|nr:hypothetical protein B0H10DRAFT_1965569 [Mycena sp. CBHHK59/15]
MSLQPRYSCLQCPLSRRCAAFVASDIDPRTQATIPRLIPATSSETCVVCMHPWICHEAAPFQDTAHVNFHYRRGSCPTTQCGGFYSDQPRWSFLTACICLAQWMSHDPIVDPAPTSITTTSSVPATIPAPAPLALSAPAPPITAFQAASATSVVPGSVGTRRISSALRTLPQHQASSSSTSSSTTAAASRRGPRRPYPSSDSPFSLDITIAVAVYPLVIPGPYEPAGYGTRKLRAQNEHMLDYYNRFQQHGLLFTLKVPASGIMSPTDFTSAIVRALGHNHLSLPPSPDVLSPDVSSQLHKQPWAILQPTRRADVITFNSHPTISATMFGIEEFQKLNKKCKNPDPTTAPRYGNIGGPIDCVEFNSQILCGDGRHLIHPCFGIRALYGLPIAGNSFEFDPECYSDLSLKDCYSSSCSFHVACSTEVISNISIVNYFNEFEGSVTNHRVCQRQGSLDELMPLVITTPPVATPIPEALTSLPIASELVTFHPLPPVIPQYPVLRREDVRPLERGKDIVNATQIYMWQVHLGAQVLTSRVPYLCRFNMHAETIETGANGLQALLLHMEERSNPDDPFVLPPGIISCQELRSKESFFRDLHLLRLIRSPSGVRNGSDVSVSFGLGPERAVYRQAITDIIGDHKFWQLAAHSAFFVPVFAPGSVEIPARINIFSSYGTLLAIHCYALGLGPVPVSAWLLLAIIRGRQGMLVPREFLAALDPVAFDCLAPWLTIEPGARIPSDFAHPFCQFLFNVMDMQPTLIDSPQTQEVHDSWTITFMSKVLLGTTTLWTHPEFLALQRGFNIRVGTTTIVEGPPLTSFGWQKFTADHDALPMLACLYDREVKSIDQIMSRVTWRILMRASDGTTPYFGALFRILLFRYLNGVGHPEQLRGSLVDEEEWSKQVNNHLLRANLLLETGSDNDLLPTGDS